MKFFLPDWDDRVDPGYDFPTDRMTLSRKPYDDLYAHELFDERVYDGILVSRMALESAARKRQRAEQIGMRAYLRMPDDLELFGDCGAFGYIGEREPSFSTEDILEYYDRLGFDYGVSVDHIILPESADQRRFRYRLTLRNAEAFLAMHRAAGLDFTPVGAAQGWDEASYSKAADALIEMGYEYIAVGGLARSSTREITRILTVVSSTVAGRARLHVFGVARAALLPLLLELGIASADSAAPLRQAWLSAKSNYYTEDGGAFAAIRIPAAKDGRALTGSLVGRSDATYGDLKAAEQGGAGGRARVRPAHARHRGGHETHHDVRLDAGRASVRAEPGGPRAALPRTSAEAALGSLPVPHMSGNRRRGGHLPGEQPQQTTGVP